MKGRVYALILAAGLGAVTPCDEAAANAYREKGKLAQIAGSTMSVTPPRDWNRLSLKPGDYAETWTLDGEQLNDVTFYSAVEPGKPILPERNKKRAPLPKFTKGMLLVEVPELLEGTYRANKKTGAFLITGSKAEDFLGRRGIRFTYEYTDSDELPRKGEAHAALIEGKLYMATFDAPRLHYFDRTIDDFRAIVATARLSGGSGTVK